MTIDQVGLFNISLTLAESQKVSNGIYKFNCKGVEKTIPAKKVRYMAVGSILQALNSFSADQCCEITIRKAQ